MILAHIIIRILNIVLKVNASDSELPTTDSRLLPQLLSCALNHLSGISLLLAKR
jgi:hypothetical protein